MRCFYVYNIVGEQQKNDLRWARIWNRSCSKTKWNKQKKTTTTIIHVQHFSYMRLSSDATRKAHHYKHNKTKANKKTNENSINIIACDFYAAN